MAIAYGWVDSPCDRKNHTGQVPLIGGVSVFIALCSIYLFDTQLIHLQNSYFLISLILVSLGFIDDKFNLSALSRLCLLFAISIWLVSAEGLVISNLGDLLGIGEIIFKGYQATIFSIFAIVGCVTCFNMIDGIDGLLGGISTIIFLSLSLLLYLSGHYGEAIFSFVFAGALVPYIILNLTYRVSSHRKVFMGDSGSFLIGFTVVWLLIVATQPSVTPNGLGKTINSVTALWVIAVPLMDMVLVMFKRVMKKQSPFKADRTHLHHVLLKHGYSNHQTLFIICLFSMIVSSVGIAADSSFMDESIMFIAFLALFVLYSFVNIKLSKGSKLVSTAPVR
ncbi:UDP-N-acetylglucosamine--undecaprenyl-phosphate N-acetylglucosaminephosphotransferase [Vibrio lamellibrachiae]